MVGFTGSRSLGSQYQPLVAQVVAGFAGCTLAGHSLAVGCAAGLDLFVRRAYVHIYNTKPLSIRPNSLNVFWASSYGSGKAALVKRSKAMVQSVAGSGQPLVVGFVTAACPQGVSPSASFYGGGSGTWGTLAYAVGLGVPVRVYLCGVSPAALPQHWPGSWLAGPGGCWVFVPSALQASLF